MPISRGLAALFLSTVALAAEPLPGLQSTAGVDSRGASFRVEGVASGSYFTATPWAVFPLVHGLWAELRAPVAWVSLGSFDAYGLADFHTALGWRALEREGLQLDVSLAETWPVGDPHQSLGSGQLTLAPGAALQLSQGPGYLRAAAALRWALPWGAHGLHEHLCLDSPYDTLDLALAVEAGVDAGRYATLFARIEPTVTLVAAPVWPVGSRAYVGGGARAHAGSFFAEGAALVPLTANRFEDWQARASLGARF